MPIDLREKFGKLSSDPRSKNAADKFKKLETGVWRALDPVGKVSNRLAARMGAEAFWPTELADGELDKAARILRTFTIDGAHADEGPHAEASGGVDAQHHANPTTQHTRQKVLRKIPPKALQQACGVAIFTCFRTGFGWSGAGGSGVVLARKPDGSWSAPSGILIHTIGWGAVIGLDVYDVVLVIRKPETLQAFTRPKVSVGGELSVAAGPVGNGAVVEAGADGKPVWSYVKSKGLYVGLQLDGTIVLKRDDANARLYGRPVSVADIFAGSVPAPPAAQPLLQTLYAAEGRPQMLGTHAIPQGKTPGDIAVSEEELQSYQASSQQGQDYYQGPPGPPPPPNAATAISGSGYKHPKHETAESAALSEATRTQHGQSAGHADQVGAVGSDAPPPSYDEAAPGYGPVPDAPPQQPRDAAAEKEALRARYAQEAAVGGGGGATTSSSSGVGSRVEALYDFAGTEAGDLSFTVGQAIEVIGQEGDQWYRGRLTGPTGTTSQGIFPANYVRWSS